MSRWGPASCNQRLRDHVPFLHNPSGDRSRPGHSMPPTLMAAAFSRRARNIVRGGASASHPRLRTGERMNRIRITSRKMRYLYEPRDLLRLRATSVFQE